MTVAVLSIGTEITRGEIVNSNAAWLSEELTRLGLDVAEAASIPDDHASIQSTLRRLAADHDAIVSTGGLGPTTDDITTECVAAVLGVPLERDEPSLSAIRERMTRFGRTMAASNMKQADFPKGARVLSNPNGTAPGFAVQIGHAKAYFMPGVPLEMKPMFTNHVAAEVTGTARIGIHQVRLRTFGLPESTVNDRLAGIEEVHGVIIGYRARFPEIEVKVLARAGTEAEAEATARAAANAVSERLGEVIYAEGDVSFARVVGDLCRERSLSLCTAESCTGGLVAQLLTDEPGSSSFFVGAVVAYANAIKTNVLGVDETLIAEKGAVSSEVARKMAEGARRTLSADVALSITGIAGPTGGTPEKPVGLVHYAVATADGTTDRKLLSPTSRSYVRLLSAYAGMRLVRDVLLHGHERADR
jgi:nicotinamide-nucleotide amidase